MVGVELSELALRTYFEKHFAGSFDERPVPGIDGKLFATSDGRLRVYQMDLLHFSSFVHSKLICYVREILLCIKVNSIYCSNSMYALAIRSLENSFNAVFYRGSFVVINYADHQRYYFTFSYIRVNNALNLSIWFCNVINMWNSTVNLYTRINFLLGTALFFLPFALRAADHYSKYGPMTRQFMEVCFAYK